MVRSLNLTKTEKYPHNQPRLDAILLGCILSKLPNIEELTLKDVRWGSVAGGNFGPLPALPSPIPLRSLSLNGLYIEGEPIEDPDVDEGPLDYFTSLTSLFSRVDKLRCTVHIVDHHFGGFDHISTDPPSDPWCNPGFQVKSFTWRLYSNWVVSEVVRNSASAGILTHLDVGLPDWEAVAAFSALVQDVGQAIKRLTIRTTYPDDFHVVFWGVEHFHRDPESGGES